MGTKIKMEIKKPTYSIIAWYENMSSGSIWLHVNARIERSHPLYVKLSDDMEWACIQSDKYVRRLQEQVRIEDCKTIGHTKSLAWDYGHYKDIERMAANYTFESDLELQQDLMMVQRILDAIVLEEKERSLRKQLKLATRYAGDRCVRAVKSKKDLLVDRIDNAYFKEIMANRTSKELCDECHQDEHADHSHCSWHRQAFINE